MRMSLDMAIGQSRGVAGISVSLTGLTSNATYGLTAQIGTHAGIGATMSDAAAISAYAWGSTLDGVEYGTGTAPTDFTASDGATLYLKVTSGGIDYYATSTVRYAAPVAAGALADESLTDGVAMTTKDISADYTGSNLTITLQSGTIPTGLTFSDPNLSGTPSGTAASSTLVFRATNSGGTADTAFDVTVNAAGAVLSVLSVSAQETDGDVPLSYTISLDSLTYFVLTTSATKPTAAQVTSGNDHLGASAPESFSSTLTTTGSPINAAITSTTLDASYYIHAVVSGGADGDVITATGTPVAIDTTPPVLVPASCTPADGATGVAVGSNITLIFDETVVAGTGNFYIYSTAGPTLVETIAVGAATIGTTDVVLNPVSDLSASTAYSVRWDAGVVTDGNASPVAVNSTDTLLNFTTGAGGTTYRTDDTGALYWFAPDSVVHTTGTISSWDDKKAGGYDLTASGTHTLPSYDVAGDFVDFSGTDLLANTTFTIDTDGMADQLQAGNDAVVFIVAELDASGQADNTTQRYTVLQEGDAPTRSYNQAMNVGFWHDTNGADTTGGASWNKAFSEAWNTDNTGATDLNATLVILEIHIDQTTVTHLINGTSVGTGSITAANFADWATGGLYLGAMADFNIDGFSGKVYEVFATASADTTSRDNIRAELNSVYSVY